MIAFDSDVLSDIWQGTEPYASRARSIPFADRGIPLAVAQEVIQGRFEQIRKAGVAKVKTTLPQAYEYFELTLTGLRGGVYLPFSDVAHNLVKDWKSANIRVKTMDMRIAAIAISCNVTLITRNVRDFKLIPGLQLDVWT